MDEQELRARLAQRYEIEREIGRGGMATVYLARDVTRDRLVAVKVLSDEVSSALGTERFRREIRLAAQLTHPNILPVYDSGEVGEALYLVMPYVDGGSLRTRIITERQLTVDDAVRISTEVANALDYAHRQGVIHRDIKPENILFADGHAFVADFGVARAINAAGEDRITRSGVTLGTPLYMSPEQAAAESHLDGRSDLYSLACCTYEMLVGSPPFAGPTAQVVIARHSLEQVPSLVIARQGIPEHVEASVMRGLAKAPADRFRTTAEYADALNARISVTMPRISGPVQPVRQPPTRNAGRRAAIALIAVGAVAIAAWAWYRPRNTVRAATADLNARRLAVTYFDDRSGGKLAYLADGLTEELISRLRGVHGLDVISANGVRNLRDATPDSVAKALAVGTVVQGSIEPTRGDSVRVDFRLIEAASGVDFKRASFTAAASNVLALRDQIAERAATFLRERLGEEIKLQARRAETSSPDAWSLLQQGERQRKEAEAAAADDSLDAAAQRFARADSLLARAEQLDARWPAPIVLRGTIAYRQARLERDRLRAGEAITRGLGHAERALALDSRDADALELRGTLRYLRWLLSLEPDPTRAAALLRDAEGDLRAAVQISPSNASAWSTLSHLQTQKPDATEAKLDAQRAYEEDAYLTTAPDIVWRLYTTSYDLEDFAGAEQWCTEGRRRFPSNPHFTECRLWLMTPPTARPDINRGWALIDSLHRLWPGDNWAWKERQMKMVVAAAITRAATVDSAQRATLADSARRVVARARATPAQDPEGELLGMEALVDVFLGDKPA
ncbi:MAG TPA: serine/threonine-protein kinase, partial [Gemmatimonadaceae bacterium]